MSDDEKAHCAKVAAKICDDRWLQGVDTVGGMTDREYFADVIAKERADAAAKERAKVLEECTGLTRALRSCKNLTRYQEHDPETVGEVGVRVGRIVDDAVAYFETLKVPR